MKVLKGTSLHESYLGYHALHGSSPLFRWLLYFTQHYHYYSGNTRSYACLLLIQGLIFVVDSNDRERLTEAKAELDKMVSIST